MTQAEYPDTTWAGPPRAYGRGRDGKGVRLSVIHYTAGSESRTSAEAGAAYDKTRTDGTSCHVFHDPDSSVQEVLRADRSNSAFSKGNRLGVHHELCGTAQTTAQWFDDASDAILWRAARAVAKDCVDFNLQVRRLSVAEVRACWYGFPSAPGGICGHVDITRAFPEDHGDHTDPGDGFPWAEFIRRVRGHVDVLRGTVAPASASIGRRNTVIMYYCTSNDRNDGRGTPKFAVAGMSPGTPANWVEAEAGVPLTQEQANAYAARFGDAMWRSQAAYAALKVEFLAPLSIRPTGTPA